MHYVLERGAIGAEDDAEGADHKLHRPPYKLWLEAAALCQPEQAEVRVKAEGSSGIAEIVGEHLELRRKRFFGKSTGVRTIPVASLTAVQLVEAGALRDGHIHFAYPGSELGKGPLLSLAANLDAILFTRNQQPSFIALRDELRRRTDRPARSIPAEIEEYAGLRDRGVITLEEFEAKKRQLLSL